MQILSTEIDSVVQSVGSIPAVFSSLKVYPNPARQQVVIDLSLATRSNVQLRLLNSLGQQVEWRQLSNFTAGRQQLNVAGLPRGVYLLMVQTQKGEGTSRRLVLN